jgi:ABC-type glycerol-3-phosphate transport system substrate-binding protein
MAFTWLLAGCAEHHSASKSMEKRLAGVALRIACPAGAPAVAVDRYSREWQQSTGARLEIVTYLPGQEPPSADLWLVSTAGMPHWASANLLQPVPRNLVDSDPEYNWQSTLATFRSQLLVWGGEVYALPVLGSESVLFYRTDLLQDGKNRDAFQKRFGHALPAPDAWQDVMELAEFFHNQPRPGIGRPCASLPPLPRSDAELDYLFYAAAAPIVRRGVREEDRQPPPDNAVFSFHYDIDTVEVRIDKSGFVYALDLLKKLNAFRPPQAADDPAEAFARGEAVLCRATPSSIPSFNANPLVRDKFAIAPLPGSRIVFDYGTGNPIELQDPNRIPYLGADGWLGAVPKDSQHAREALSLLMVLSGPTVSKDIVVEPEWGGGVFRRDQLESRFGWYAFGLDAARTGMLLDSLRETVLHPQIKNPAVRLRIPDELEHRQALDVFLKAALRDGEDARQALGKAAARWREIDGKKSRGEIRKQYRLSLGLSGD